jgi:hypothetical protein
MKSAQTPEWKQVCLEVALQMRIVMMPFVTPLVRVEADGGGEHIGSGGYVEYATRKLLLTNDHVARDGLGRLTHKFYDSDQYFGFPKAFAFEMAPTDLAASPVDQTWPQTTHSAMPFPDHRFAERHAPAKNEMLFMLGFAGKRAYYSPTLGMMVTNGTPYLSQEFDPDAEERKITSPDFDPKVHFAIPWEPEQVSLVDEHKDVIPLSPKGFSGSLVWNTRYVEYTTLGKSWDPAVARLTGIVWGWPSEDRVLIATRIEHIKDFLRRIP